MNTALIIITAVCAVAELVLCALAAYTDLKKRIIPDIFPLLIALCGIIRIAAAFIFGDSGLSVLVSAICGAFLGFAVTALSGAIVKNGVGGGDIKLVTALCFCFGLQSSFRFCFYAVLSAAVCGLVLVAMRKKTVKSTIPFAPFLLIGAAVTTGISVLA